jgi:hypothetical protein
VPSRGRLLAVLDALDIHGEQRELAIRLADKFTPSPVASNRPDDLGEAI